MTFLTAVRRTAAFFFEETAGITKYRTRKQEALRKLRENEGDLVRLGDIMCAHREELEPLSIQAEKTMQFRKLDEERRQYLLVALVQQYDQLIREQESITQALNVHRDEEARENTGTYGCGGEKGSDRGKYRID